MIQKFSYNRIVAPVKEIWSLWEREKRVTLPWFFDLLEGFIDPRPIFPFVDLDSAFFEALHREFKHRNICPEYIISADDFFNKKSLLKLLEENVCLSLLIFKPLGPEVIEKIKFFDESFNHQLKFVVLARKDWNFKNTYRSIPSFIRSRLYVDFPVPLQSRDPFLSFEEWIPVVEFFRKQFPGFPVRSYCPNLFLYTEFLNFNVSHFSGPGKSSQGGKHLSFILDDFNELKIITGLETIIHHSDQVEILLAQTDGNTLPFSSVSVRPYRVYSKEPGKPVSKVLVNNFLASQATGQYLVFPNKKIIGDFGNVLNTVFKKSFDEFELLTSQKAMIFRRSDFLKMGGFDPLFTDESLVWFDSLFRYSLFKKRDFNYKTKRSLDQWDMIFHKYACEEKFGLYPLELDSRFLSKKKFKKSSDKTGVSVYFKRSSDKKVFFKKSLKKILIFFLMAMKFCNQWRKLWVLVFYRFYGFVFYLFYFFHKIYCFCEFQYEKRVLNFHKDK